MGHHTSCKVAMRRKSVRGGPIRAAMLDNEGISLFHVPMISMTSQLVHFWNTLLFRSGGPRSHM
jgi:hypothetical protein